MLWLLCRTSCKIIAGAARRAHSAHRTPSCARRRGRHRPCWPRSDRVSALERGRALDFARRTGRRAGAGGNTRDSGVTTYLEPVSAPSSARRKIRRGCLRTLWRHRCLHAGPRPCWRHHCQNHGGRGREWRTIWEAMRVKRTTPISSGPGEDHIGTTGPGATGPTTASLWDQQQMMRTSSPASSCSPSCPYPRRRRHYPTSGCRGSVTWRSRGRSQQPPIAPPSRPHRCRRRHCPTGGRSRRRSQQPPSSAFCVRAHCTAAVVV